MIAIIDYGMGNLRSVQKGFERVGCEALVTADPKVVLEADKIVLPGVGAFPDCMRNLEEGGFVEPLLRVIREGRLFLGICLGLQLLFTESDEFGVHKGLGIIPGRVVRFPEGMVEAGEALKVPHMGWNQRLLRPFLPCRPRGRGCNCHHHHLRHRVLLLHLEGQHRRHPVPPREIPG